MSQENDLPTAEMQDAGKPVRRRWLRLQVAILLVVALGLTWAWISRKTIADDLISGQLEKMGLPATYKVRRISPQKQVITDLVVGDPKRPDLTVERIEIATRLDFGVPGIGRITLVRPRLYGSYRNGKVSFGSLDKVLFTGSKEPFRLPDLDVAVVDGRSRIDTDFGAVGVKLAGQGGLRGRFDGVIAAVAPGMDVSGCKVRDASLYGKVAIRSERPHFEGPLRIGGGDCPQQAAKLRQSAMQVALTLDQALDGGEGKFSLKSGGLVYGDLQLGGLDGNASLTYRKAVLNSRFTLAGRNLAVPHAGAKSVGFDGRMRASGDLRRVEIEGDVAGSGLRGGAALDRSLKQVQASVDSTLAGSLLGRIRPALARESRDSSLRGNVLVRRTGQGTVLTVPSAVLRGGSGAAIASLSRFQFHLPLNGAPPLVAGNFSTGGPGLPRAAGSMERAEDGNLSLRLTMDEYRADDARLGIPDLVVVRSANGAIGLSGEIRATGAIPGGYAENLILPIEGGIAANGDVQLWRNCALVRFDRLDISTLTLDKRSLPVCPPRGGAIVAARGGAWKVAGGVASLDLAGKLGETPIRIASGPAGFAWPGQLAVRAVDVTLGPPDTASKFRIANLDARLGSEIGGTFENADVALYAVPLDLHEASGNWRYADGVLSLADGAFRLVDRQQVPRFQPLMARDATLTLADNRIEADATMREPRSDRQVVSAKIHHDLSTGSGHANLGVPALVFDDVMQPDTLSTLALGVIANAKGEVRGTGRIDWNERGVQSNGRFSTDSLDFAAAFGPVKGLSGAVEFTDLLGLVTAPNQSVRVASINPGIEVNDGTLGFDLRPGYVLDITGGTWPFMGGTLTLAPATMTLGIAETRRYVLKIDGLDAAKFVERMELANLSATGTFDGELPLVFDENGGRIEGGMLTARSPGGNVSYVGQLTYKDLSAMANFAFAALRSLNYQNMSIGMDGALEGEIVTRVRFNGVSQGDGTSSNFLTRKIASLPLQFNVNVRAPFIQLVSSFKSFYDPAFLRDPRSLGLIGADGKRIEPAVPKPKSPAQLSPDRAPASIQPTESDNNS